jgi:molybdopterin-guanine dinucleotide biosynthesis protein A
VAPETPAVPPGAARTGRLDAIVLAGGRGARLGGADKPAMIVGGGTLAAAVVTAAAEAGAGRVVMVGPRRPELRPLSARLPAGLLEVREDPAGSGPVPALRCGLAHVRAPWVAVLAADLPFLRGRQLTALLAAAAPAGPDDPGASPAASGAGAPGAAGAVLVDDAGRPQWLVSCWQTGPLRAALSIYRGASLRGLFQPLRPVLARWQGTDGQPPPWLDCDTPADLSRARDWHAQRARSQAGGPAQAEGAPMNTLQAWTEAACAELGLDPAAADVRKILDLARDAAHQVERPAAPLTTFLLGLAVGSGQPLAPAAEQLSRLAEQWDAAGH